ncbi:suppressor of cytokine signaling 4-like [Hypanus sabinus]|uniref:suppressor of cytokine signaling 4-like n=1 Tax=Hypanus sabinus TaxID=79690 RepID=UPI0028C445E3|nr:suppressor of cytokine signaling 4-like [Hypanus sabinus]XP_059813621.1 suppressor of cytokine signaling 4-like [Hypanus sabinus]XP_059813629.1 suppressor of cytokine signaling 4-like [Hypanus sabinus]
MSHQTGAAAHNLDVKPKDGQGKNIDRRDGYAWSGKKRSRTSKVDSTSDGEVGDVAGILSITPRREKKWSSELDLEDSCSRKLSSRSLKQKIQDAVAQCFPLKANNHKNSVALISKSKIHINDLVNNCTFPAGMELAEKWDLINWHTIPLTQNCDIWEGSAVGFDEEEPGGGCRMSVELEVNPSDTQIHNLEVISRINALHGQDSEVESGITELAGDSGITFPSNDSDSDEEMMALFTDAESQANTKLDFENKCNWLTPFHKCQTQFGFTYCLVPDLFRISNNPCYWGVMDRYGAEALLEGKPEGTYLLRDSAQEDYLFSVSFRRYSRSLHARIEQWNHNFSFDAHDPCVFHAPSVTGLLEHYSDPNSCMFFEPLLSLPLNRTFPFSLQHLCRAVICSHTTYDGIGALPVPPSMKTYLKEYHYKQKIKVLKISTQQWHSGLKGNQ